MKKYLLIVKNNFQSNLVYRFGTYAIFVGETLVFVFFFYLWSSIYSSGQNIGSYSLKEMISYYLILNFLFLTTKNNGVSWTVGDEIRYGELSNNLLKPFSYFGYTLSWAIGRLFYSFSVYSIIYILLFIILRNYINFPEEVFTVFMFFLLAMLGFFINFLITYIIGLTAFWLGMIMGLSFAAMSTIAFLEGGFVPLDLLPDFVNKINNFLPFKYVVFIPISLFTNRISFSWELVAVPVFWIIFLYILAKAVYNKGIKKYEGFGA
ncbi:MAG: ABC-2 family transporter protein [Candidatus Moraniibacteriota bacterium]